MKIKHAQQNCAARLRQLESVPMASRMRLIEQATRQPNVHKRKLEKQLISSVKQTLGECAQVVATPIRVAAEDTPVVVKSICPKRNLGAFTLV